MTNFNQTLIERRSCRKYLPKQVEADKLEEILTVGTYAATGSGKQSPRILVVQDAEEIAYLEKLNASYTGNPDGRPFYGAPTVCVVLAKADASTAVEDGALVIGNLMAAAHSLGVASCWIHRAREVFASDSGKALLKKWGVEGDYIGVGHCILGYADGALQAAAPRKEDYITRV